MDEDEKGNCFFVLSFSLAVSIAATTKSTDNRGRPMHEDRRDRGALANTQPTNR